MLVDHAPVPPHERPWRHPSELAPTRSDLDPAIIAPTRSPIPLLAGTLAVAAVVVLVLAMTPDRGTTDETAAVTTLPAFTTTPASALASATDAASTASFGFARFVAIPRAVATAPPIAEDVPALVEDDTTVYLVTDQAIYRTRWHDLRVHADPTWLTPLGAAVVVTADGHLVAEIVDGELDLSVD